MRDKVGSEFHEANGENMKIVIIHGQSHKGSTYHIAHMLAEKNKWRYKRIFSSKRFWRILCRLYKVFH